MSNFVDVVGFQFERIHSGFMKWVLNLKYNDAGNNDFTKHDKENVFWALYGSRQNENCNLVEISPFMEFSFGRKLRIDLVLQAKMASGDLYDIVIEMKVDSAVNFEQLENTKKEYENVRPNKTNIAFLVITLGAGKYSIYHIQKAISNLGFVMLEVNDVINIFSQMSPQNVKAKTIFDDWIDALRNEADRDANILYNLKKTGSVFKLKDFKYREGIVSYYPYYNKLLHSLRPKLNLSLVNCEIANGVHNAVFYLGETLRIQKNGFAYYWEFNDNSLCLKAQIMNPSNDLEFSRAVVISLCQETKVSVVKDLKSRASKKSKANWVTVYKWDFEDFGIHSFDDVVDQTVEIITAVQSRL